MSACPNCAGSGSVDTGGSTPWGAWITTACPYCNGSGENDPCPACHGEGGQVQVNEEGDDFWDACQQCGGSGVWQPEDDADG